MASSSPGSVWGPVLIKGCLSRKPENETQNVLLEIAKCVEKSSFPKDQDDFYTTLSILLADFFIRNASQKNLVFGGIISSCCKSFAPSLIAYLKRATNDMMISQISSFNVVQPSHVLLALKGLCTGTLEINDNDFELFENHLKQTDTIKELGTVAPESLKKNQPDLQAALLDQIVSLIPGAMFEKSITQVTVESEHLGVHKKESSTQNLAMVCSQNISMLCSSDAADTLVNFCLALPFLSGYVTKWNAVTEGGVLCLPSSISEAQAVKQNIAHLKEDIFLAKQSLSLPLLEPLTKDRLRQITQFGMGCLLAALSVATSHSIFAATSPLPVKSAASGGSNAPVSKPSSSPNGTTASVHREDEWESCVITVVETAIEIYQTMASLIQRSPRSGRIYYDNFLYLASWLLLSGLHGQMCSITQGAADKTQKDDKGKSPSKHKESPRINLTKIQQGYGGLSVVLASQALATLEKLLEPTAVLEAETIDSEDASPAGFDITEHYNHAQRIARLLTDVPFTQLLFHIATISYRKSCNLKRIQKGGDGETISLSDSATYYDDDDFSCSEESSPAEEEDDDEDSEPILGHWFEETITPAEPKGKNKGGHDPDEMRNSSKGFNRNLDISQSVPDKGEPHGYIVLATQLFAFMNDHMLWPPKLRQYTVSSLSEHQLILLAAILKDLDRETARTETGTIASLFGQTLGQLFNRFSQALARYTHNLLAGDILNPSLQSALLSHLNINPWSKDEDWPLLVYPRSLAVLAQVVLSKHRRGSKEDIAFQPSESACLNIWSRMLATMLKHIEDPQGARDRDKEIEDLNVEHSQLLLFLFHLLQLMQKKAILLLCAQTLIQAAQAAISNTPLQDSQLMLLARILLLLEYLIKHLYDAPASMLEQLQWNLLEPTCPSVNGKSEEAQQASRMFNCCQELEDNYRKYGSEEEGCSMRPRFYLLSSVESNSQDLPKLDGLACSFLLAPSDSFKYSALYGAILKVLHVVRQCELHGIRKDKRDYNALCAIQYCFNAAWRLIQCLPPSVPVMESLSNSEAEMEPSCLLHTTLWGPRAAHKVYNAWITDCLVKQGLTTQKAIFIVKTAAKYANSTSFLVKMAKQLGQGMRQTSQVKEITSVPDLWDVLLMDMIIARLRLLYDECANKDNGDESYRVLDSPTEKLPKTSKISKEIFMELCDLVDSVANLSRRCVLHDALGNSTDTPTLEGSCEAEALQHLLAISSTRGCKLANITPALSSCLPPFLRAALERWNSSTSEFPAFFSWRSGQSGDLIPSESYLNGILNTHLKLLSSQPVFSPASSLRHLLNAAVRLANDLVVWYPNTEEAEKELVGVFFPIALDACFENLVDLVQLVMERLVGAADSDRYQDIASYIVISHCHSLVTASGAPIRCLEEKALEECISFLESCVDNPLTRHPLSRFYTFEKEQSLWAIVFSTTNPELSTAYRKSVYRFLNKLLKAADSNDTDLDNLCVTLLNLEGVEEELLEAWVEFAILRHLENGVEVSPDSAQKPLSNSAPTVEEEKTQLNGSHQSAPHEGILLLQNLTQFAVRKGEAEHFAHTLLKILLKQLSSSGRGTITPELVVIMIKLAAVGQGSGHRDLFLASLDWLRQYRRIVRTESWSSLSPEDLSSPPAELASFCCLLQYMTDVLHSLKTLSTTSSAAGAEKPAPDLGEDILEPIDGSPIAEVEDWVDELGLGDDAESEGDESDEDLLCNQLCTYTITQKEFMNQHWYHCHTCRMVDGVGVCSVCAKVCHRDHDVTYAKFGSFFCDCGAKVDGSCQALARRPPEEISRPRESGSASTGRYQAHDQALLQQLGFGTASYVPYRGDIDLIEGIDRASVSDELSERRRSLTRQLEPYLGELLQAVATSELPSIIGEILGALLPSVEQASKRLSPVGSLQRARNALHQLHNEPKSMALTESPLMIPMLGSQEGAFENVRMSFTGDQGQTIRQLLSAHVLRRVSMCCLSSPHGRRQHLAMSHEKGKVTVLQLSSLLKQPDASKRKLTLNRLSSAPVPFTVLSMASNPANEDVLAVSGLKEVHIMTLSSGGSVQEHLALHPQLETGNFIIKSAWLPGQSTQLAVITADFVKIYDLSVDVLSPQYFFLLPSGKVRDCSFWFGQEGTQYVFFISSSGYIYWQPLSAESSARHGPFYVTNVLEVSHPDLKESNGQTGAGGVSVYYSHCLQLLCFSYAAGKTFMASVSEDERHELKLGPLHSISVPSKTSSSSSGGGSLKLNSSGSGAQSSGAQQPLCQWSEVQGHPGLFLTLTQSSYTPVIIMVEPERILVEEIKVASTKVKVTDLVAVRHLVNTSQDKMEQRTTLILLCDDGSLRIFMASPDLTNFWLAPTLQPPILPSPQGKLARKESVSGTKPSGSSTPTFPTDFFENCTAMNDAEFGGNDLLHVYNVAQLKHRLNTAGLYIACTKPSGFSIEITNSDTSSVIVGVRIQVGSQDVQRAPSSVEVFGRTIPFVLQRQRWFDIPLAKEESLQADKKLVLTFGCSNDPLGVTMVDSIKVYGRTKESFGWPDDVDDQLAPTASNGTLNVPSSQGQMSSPIGHPSGYLNKLLSQSPAQLVLDQLVGGALSLLEGSLSLQPQTSAPSLTNRDHFLELSTQILIMSWSASSYVPTVAKQLLSCLHSSKIEYHEYKDRVLLTATMNDLKAIIDEKSSIYLDPEAFYSILTTAKSVATSKPLNLIKFTSDDFLNELLAVGRLLHKKRSRNTLLSPVGQLGIAQIDFAVQMIVDLLMSFALTEPDRFMASVLDHYLSLLLCDDPSVSHAAKAALQRTIKVGSSLKSHTVAPHESTGSTPKIPTDDEGMMEWAIAMSWAGEMGSPVFTKYLEDQHSSSSADRFRQLRLSLLHRITDDLPELKKKEGFKSIHFLQVLLILVSELRPTDADEKCVLQRALMKAVAELELERDAALEVAGQRTPQHEVQLLIMKFFGFLLSTHHKSSSSGRSSQKKNAGSTVASMAAKVLLDAGLMERCLVLLQAILQHWKATGTDEMPVVAGLLKHPMAPANFDLSPFFPRSINRNTGYVFEGFSQLLTEMALRLPYLVKKVNSSVHLDQRWVECLCQYVSAPTPSAVKRHVRKLLLFHCGSKDKYRQCRDLLTLDTHFKDVKQLVAEHGLDSAIETTNHEGLVLPYDDLVVVMEHLKACLEVASTRTANWQLYCQQKADTLLFLIRLACCIDDGVCCTLLQLLRYAFCPLKAASSSSPTAQPAVCKKSDVDPSQEPWDLESSCTGVEGCVCGVFVQQLHETVERRLISRLVFRFLLDCNVTAVRWHAHALLNSICRHSSLAQQQDIVALMWSLWSGLQLYGRKAAQFVDLLGYFTIKTPGLESCLPNYVDQAVALLKEENQLIVRHPNAVLYNALSNLVNLDGHYLERDPCLACSAVELPFGPVKLTTLKADVRFTTSTQIIKLIGSHVVNRFALRITDIKRTKMVRTINIYYNNRPVQAAVELKNKPGVWLKAKKLSLTPGQAEVKVDLPLPITCCNLKIEFAAFYENLHASSEMLQCPRCSASVPAHPGVCSNCGENVYQCHKCRSINYDEKDPFLCNACGFCKYAKFELTLSAKPCCTVEPVESEDDRKKSLQAINTFLEKADRLQTQLGYTREALEVLVNKLGDNAGGDDGTYDGAIPSALGVSTPAASATAGAISTAASNASASTQINRTIQQIAQRYHSEAKSTFEELSKLAQRVAACRKEVVSYDTSQRQKAVKRSGPGISGDNSFDANQLIPLPTGTTYCYSCASAALDHCLTLLRAMATKPFLRKLMFEQGVLQELLHHNIAQGSAHSRVEVRDLLCLLTLNNADAVDCLNQKLMESVDGVLKRSGHSLALLNSIRNEMALFAASLQCQDSCWEKRLRSVVQLFLKSTHHLESPAVMDVITLPCLKIIQELIQGPTGVAIVQVKESSKAGHVEVLMDLKRWLQGDPQQSFDAWKSRVITQYDAPIGDRNPEQVHQLHLMQKYGARWRDKFQQHQQHQNPIPCHLTSANWLQSMLFNPNSRLSRQTACVFLEGLARVVMRRQEIINLLTSFLAQLGQAGPYGAEFFALYMSLVRKDHWRYYLVCRGLLPKLAEWIEIEINSLSRQETAGRSSELSQGYAMKSLVELLAFFLEEPSVRQAYKGRLVGHVLNGYLSLRRLVLQRTRLVEETQDLLLQLLGDMTTGTEAETKQFMSVCVQTLRHCRSDDLVTPVFVVERLCSIIHPEEKDDVEFFMSLDKDPQQEDFLQGRMQGNPYSSNEPGLGPLMRDIKNKICQDCELIALLEDDTGMELLVCNKIMSLDLPVRDVYRKVFLVENSEGDPMRIVYRMRGLLGDATEEFVERFDDKHQRPTNDEETYRLANVMGECGGLDVLLERLSCVRDIQGEGRSLLGALVKLLSFCTKVQTNRSLLTSPEMIAIQRLLVALKLCLQAQQMPPYTEQLLEVMEAILSQASTQSVENYAQFSSTFGTKNDLDFLLQFSAQMAGSKTAASILTHLTRVIPFLTFVNDAKMDALIDHFRQSLDFSLFDTEHCSEQATKLELFCALTSGIEHNAIGNTLKDRLVASKVVNNALDYLHQNAPPIRTAIAHDSPEWKEFVAKPSVKFVLRLLTGLAHSHETTQLALAADSIPLFHRLEQISSDEHVGSLAEILLEAMRGHPTVSEKIEEVRQQTKREKKRLAMAMRENQLRALGMKTNALGQVKAENPILQQLVDMGLSEEPGPVCVICREGYRFQPGRVLAIYTFSRRCQLEDMESQMWFGTSAQPTSSPSVAGGSGRSRKTLGYYTVSHFNVVHVECHLAAVRLARARDEWESAALQNANTRCNGLLPLWGPQVPESAFASCLARHNTYLQECTGHRDIGYVSTCHDLKLLLLRFALERSFSDESGGGGPQSNMHFFPYLLHAALYVLNTTRLWSKEEKNIKAFLDTPRGEKWVENQIEAENSFYYTTLALLVLNRQRWNACRLVFLERLLVTSHCRAQQSRGAEQRQEQQVLDYSVYKPALVFFAIVNGVFNIVFKAVSSGDVDSEWPGTVADHIRHNDEAVLRSTDKLLKAYQDDYLACGSFDEFCDIAGLLEDIASPEEFIKNLVQGMP